MSRVQTRRLTATKEEKRETTMRTVIVNITRSSLIFTLAVPVGEKMGTLAIRSVWGMGSAGRMPFRNSGDTSPTGLKKTLNLSGGYWH